MRTTRERASWSRGDSPVQLQEPSGRVGLQRAVSWGLDSTTKFISIAIVFGNTEPAVHDTLAEGSDISRLHAFGERCFEVIVEFLEVFTETFLGGSVSV